jgi:hypothetical protein
VAHQPDRDLELFAKAWALIRLESAEFDSIDVVGPAIELRLCNMTNQESRGLERYRQAQLCRKNYLGKLVPCHSKTQANLGSKRLSLLEPFDLESLLVRVYRFRVKSLA